jgi:Zn-dependent metalloprotease
MNLVADVFGIAVKHWAEGNDVNTGSWLIGQGLWKSRQGSDYRALRNMASPGTAFPGDDQPDHMSGFYDGQEDNGSYPVNLIFEGRASYHQTCQ